MNKSPDMKRMLQVNQIAHDNEPENSIFLKAVHLLS